MPSARIVLPSAPLIPADSQPPLDFEGELRLATTKAAAGALDEDALEAVACIACELFGGGAARPSREALHEALAEALTDGGLPEDQWVGVIDAVLGVAADGAADLSTKTVTPPKEQAQKWLTRGAVERKRASDYLAGHALQVQEQAECEAEREKTLRDFYGAVVDVVESNAEVQKTAEKAPASDSSEEEDDDATRSFREETKQRLRDFGQPATYFGESDTSRLARLNSCELGREQDDYAHGSTNVLLMVERNAERGMNMDRDKEDEQDDRAQAIEDANGEDVDSVDEHDDEVLPVPFPVGHALREGETVRIKAVGWDKLMEGSVNAYFIDFYCSNGDILLHWGARASATHIVRNSLIAGSWGVEEIGGGWPHTVAGATIDFRFTAQGWEICIDGSRRPEFDYQHRVSGIIAGIRVSDNLIGGPPMLIPRPREGSAVGPDLGTKRTTTRVLLWLRSVLRAWEASLVSRAAEGTNAQLKAERAQFRQSKQYLKPLRRSLRDKSVDPGILTSLQKIAENCDLRKYREAKEAYMRLAIGNHAWPIGVTQVTFHDRPNRHNIGEDNVAHILDDETARKYIQMVKRLLSFCESQWPVDPSLAA